MLCNGVHKSGLKPGGHIRPGPDLDGLEEKTARFLPGPDMISGATLIIIAVLAESSNLAQPGRDRTHRHR